MPNCSTIPPQTRTSRLATETGDAEKTFDPPFLPFIPLSLSLLFIPSSPIYLSPLLHLLLYHSVDREAALAKRAAERREIAAEREKRRQEV